MTFTRLIAVAAMLACCGLSFADAPTRFRWQKGDTHRYKVEQVTQTSSTMRVDDTDNFKTLQVTTRFEAVKSWSVVDVDANGVATLQMSLTQLKVETKKPDGETSVFDSTKADPASVEGKEMMQYVNQPITTIRMDARGQLVEVKESKFGAPSRLEADLPFKLVLPEVALAQGATWARNYAIKMDPPQGTGESYDATQQYTVKQLSGTSVVVGMTTKLKNSALTAGELIPLCPLQPEGEITFASDSGRFEKARLKATHEIPNHLGVGTKYTYQMVYQEDRLEN
ncbi:hypothetical protein [Tuwongella immobilis]|uniref:Marine sediment metagenome DNA, contig: S01H1_S00476 n=1 Tax=Tuwongella immobilis TaxID=692036 RepID=A0A6C2YHS8_9BACT|nr:hypothetical protein [Tuwongella immobilis]VIP01088.1 Marine sediment metagenome DNA, contig: S01H1_S00476 OS=marine sediment metagenome GN=S01H1_25281 PE=4 SV=1 [Tuwongella immobilis]VTR97601.1 Marine sediment metagenome DNA, contig: S01H1_S00476 OS=marine sediment metagenome GN=S01H1_25281 PE=4 SV=1 [Tuwongella immobilis]